MTLLSSNLVKENCYAKTIATDSKKIAFYLRMY
jgi:hypothetical protein